MLHLQLLQILLKEMQEVIAKNYTVFISGERVFEEVKYHILLAKDLGYITKMTMIHYIFSQKLLEDYFRD